MFLTLIAFILVLGILVFAHELGHFLAAKAAGVKVEEFSIGFPPRIKTWKKAETQYTLGLLPLGGYVKMLGEDDSSKDPRAYNNATPGKRFIIGIAGVVMNLALAWILLSIAFTIGVTPVTMPSDQVPGKTLSNQIFISEVVKGSAAEKAGLKAGDEVISAQGVTFGTTKSLSDFTQANVGKEVVFKIKENNQISDKKVALSTDQTAPLGVGIIDQAIVKVPWYCAPVVALKESYGILRYTITFLGAFAKQLFTTASISDSVGGPVAIYSMSGIAARAGIVVFLQFMAMLSLNLALMNILPFPALDGGRVLFILLEKIFRKRIVREEIEGTIHGIGFVLLILFVIAVTYKDIARLIHK